MSGNHFDDDGVIDDEYNDPEFYRKLRQGVAGENPEGRLDSLDPIRL